jgi:hypothetical protein
LISAAAAAGGVLLTHRSPLIYTLWLMHRGSGCFYAIARFRAERAARPFFPAAAAAAEMRYPADFVQAAATCVFCSCCFIFLIKSDDDIYRQLLAFSSQLEEPAEFCQSHPAKSSCDKPEIASLRRRLRFAKFPRRRHPRVTVVAELLLLYFLCFVC